MNIHAITSSIQQQCAEIFKQFPVQRAAVFGSTLHVPIQQAHDIDIVIDLHKKIGLIKFIELQQLLSDKLGKPVDLVTYPSLHPALRKHIEHEAQTIYEHN